ncbi:MAG: hypothetical protein Q7R33_07680 [Nitrosarchaeum sp.]|nr:hypothetical protein [Nitrosarchaeum sp.]
MNGQIIKHDGIVANIIDSGRTGVIIIDKSKFVIAAADIAGIVITNAKTYSPWIYLGLIPQRSNLVVGQNRHPSSMGIVPESLLPSQGMGIKYFVDGFYSASGTDLKLGYYSTFLSEPGSTAFSFTPIFFMGDFLDGDGRTMVRSSTQFKAILIGENVGSIFTAQIETLAIAIFRTDAFNSVHYRKLSYNDKTYKIQKFVQTAYIYIILQNLPSPAAPPTPGTDYKNIYQNIALARQIVEKFINFETCIFKFIYAGTNQTAETNTNDEFFSALSNSGIDTNFSLTKILNIISTADQSASKGIITKTAAIIFSDYLNITNEDVTSNIAFIAAHPNMALKHIPVISSISPDVQTTNTNLGRIQKVDDMESIYESNGIMENGFQFVNLLSSVLKNTQDKAVQQNGIDANVIKEYASLCTYDFQDTSPYISDFDKDGKKTIVDRIYGIFSGYRPDQNDIVQGRSFFLNSKSKEMGFLRKICPIGQLFRIFGRINSVVPGSSGGNSLVLIDIQKWQVIDPSDNTKTIDDPNVPEVNRIYVYVEAGATSNLTQSITSDSTILLDIQGRIFHSSYISKTQLRNTIKFNDVSNIQKWFRVSVNTAEDILKFAINIPDDPILIVRSNYSPSFQSTGVAIKQPITGITLTGNYERIDETDFVDDHINFVSASTNSTNNFVTSGFGTPLQIGRSATITFSAPIYLDQIEIDFDFPDGFIQSNNDYKRHFFYKVLYKTSSQDTPRTLYQFYSARMIDSNDNKITFNPNRPVILNCEQQDTNGKVFKIVYPYNNLEDGTQFIWTWDQQDWSYEIAIGTENLTSSSSKFESAPDPTTGQFTLKDAPGKNTVIATFQNISFGQTANKFGTEINVKLISGPGNDPVLKIKDIKINGTQIDSLERVDIVFSNTAESSDSYMQLTPGYGYVYLSSKSWFVEGDVEARASTSNAIRLTGDLVSPIFYFDAFSLHTDLRNKIVQKSGQTGFPAIDIVKSNAISVSGSPFMQIFSIGYAPPPAAPVDKIAVFRSPITNRLTIVYNEGSNLFQKYSFTNFEDHDVTDGWDYILKNLRYTRGIFAKKAQISDLDFTISNNSITINVEKSGLVLIAVQLNINGNTDEKISFTTEASYGEASFGAFGYETFNGVVSQEFTSGSSVYVYFPNTTGVKIIKLTVSDGSSLPDIGAVDGLYVSGLVQGSAPSIFENLFGEYILFYGGQDSSGLNRIYAIKGDYGGELWTRPGAEIAATNRFDPLPVITGFTNPFILKSRINEDFILFVFNPTKLSIDYIYINREEMNKIKIDAENTDIETNSNSWSSYFKNKSGWQTAVNNSSSIFSANITNEGTHYVASILDTGSLRIFYHSGVSFMSQSSEENWTSSPIDLLHKDSKLFKAVNNTSVKNIYLIVQDLENTIWVFVVVSDNLILIKVSPEIIKIEGNPTDNLVISKQNEYNDIQPRLIIGNKSGLNSAFIITQGADDKSFDPQIVAAEHMETGEVWLFYLENGVIKTKISKDRGLSWGNFDHV